MEEGRKKQKRNSSAKLSFTAIILLDQSCLNLQNVLTHNSMSDISGADLAEKIISLRQFLDIDQVHPKDVLNVLNKNNWCDLFPNT